MEQRAEYLAGRERPRLTVIRDSSAQRPKFSALPHAVLFSDLSDGAVRLYAVLQSHWWQDAESCASHAVMAKEMGCSLSGIRRHLDELIAAGLIAERPSGSRRGKVYSRLPIRQNEGIDDVVNTSQATDWEPSNTSKPEIQYVKIDDSNTSKTGYSYKKTPVKKTPEKKTDTAPTEPAPKVTRSGQLIDLLRADDVPVTMRPQDHKALKDSGADPALVAEAYGALFRGDWGDDFMRRSLSVQFVIGRLAAYESWKRNPRADSRRPNGPASTGSTALREQTRQHSKWSDPHWDRVMGGAAMRGGPRDKDQSDGR